MIIAALDRMGIASAHTIVLLNCIGIAAGLAAVWWIARKHETSVRQWTILLSLLSYPLIRAVTMPRPDALYFGLSLITIALISAVERGNNARNVKLLVAAFALIAAGTTLRLAAIALIAPLFWGILQLFSLEQVKLPGRRLRVAGVMLAVIAIVAFAVAGSQNGTFARYRFEMAPNLARAPFDFFLNRVTTTLRGLGVLTLNFPGVGIPKAMPWIGFASTLLLVPQFIRLRPLDPVKIYVLTYVAVLFAWPFFDIRLWIPITPLLILHVVLTARSLVRALPARIAAGLVVAWIAFTGFGALGLTTLRSFAGENFRHRFGSNGGFSDPWRPNALHDKYAEMIIRRYDSGRAAWRWLEEDGRPVHDPKRIRW
jgi:hypothetical protein